MLISENVFLEVWQRHYIWDGPSSCSCGMTGAKDVARFRSFLADYLQAATGADGEATRFDERLDLLTAEITAIKRKL